MEYIKYIFGTIFFEMIFVFVEMFVLGGLVPPHPWRQSKFPSGGNKYETNYS